MLMTDWDFMETVRLMRDAQKLHERTFFKQWRDRAKDLEAKVDAHLAQLDSTVTPVEQPGLFDQVEGFDGSGDGPYRR